MKTKIINVSSKLKSELAALKNEYTARQRQLLHEAEVLEFWRSEKDRLSDVPFLFRWFPVMVLSVCRVIKAHRIIAGVVFWAMFIGLCALTMPWMHFVASGGEPVMDWCGYWAICSSIFIAVFFAYPWITYVYDTWRSRPWYLPGMPFVGMVYGVWLIHWGIRMAIASAETLVYLAGVVGWFVVCLIGIRWMDRKFWRYEWRDF